MELLASLGAGQDVRNPVADDHQFLGVAIDRVRTADAFAALDTSIKADGLALLANEHFAQSLTQNGLG